MKRISVVLRGSSNNELDNRVVDRPRDIADAIISMLHEHGEVLDVGDRITIEAYTRTKK